MKEKIKNQKSFIYWVRWIVLLPGALIAGFLMTFPLHWILYLAFAHNGTLLGFIEISSGANISIEYTLTPFIIAIAFILVGFEIAPNHKFKTSVIMTILWLVAFVIVFIYSQQSQFQVRGMGSILGSLIGLYIVRKRICDKDYSE